MKKLITILVLIIAFSCSDTKKSKIADGSIIEQAQNDTYLKATIDGAAFYVEDPIYYSAQKIVTLVALSKDKKEKIRIYINYNKGPAIYTFGKGISNLDNLVYTKNEGNWLAAKTMGEGTITITEKEEYLIGEFSFSGVNKEDSSTKNITNGKFRVLINSK